MRMHTAILAVLALLSSQSIAEQGNTGKKAQAYDMGVSGWLALADEIDESPAEDSDLSSTSAAAAEPWRFKLIPYAWLDVWNKVGHKLNRYAGVACFGNVSGKELL